MPIEEGIEPRNFKTCHQIVGETRGVATGIGDEDLKRLFHMLRSAPQTAWLVDLPT
jgi:hypothetical protein